MVTFGVARDSLTSGFKVSIRAFVPVWVFLYVIQFLLMPLIAQDYWVSNFFGNTMYLAALSYYFVITFLGYNGKVYCGKAMTSNFTCADLIQPYLT